MAYLNKNLTRKVGIKCKRKLACWSEEYLFDTFMGAYNQDDNKICKQSPT